MRNAADATTLLRPLKLELPAAHCDGGQGAAWQLVAHSTRGGSQSGKVRRRSETAKFGLEAAAEAAAAAAALSSAGSGAQAVAVEDGSIARSSEEPLSRPTWWQRRRRHCRSGMAY
jgi:hypothetical protein